MNTARFLILLALAVVLIAPLLVRSSIVRSRSSEQPAASDRNAPTLIVVTPHVEQIRSEFGIGFARWHSRVYGSPVRVDWRTPGGTTEIRRQLENQVRAAVERGTSGSATGGGDSRAYYIVPASTMLAPDRENPGLPEIILRPGAVEADVFMGGGSFEHTAVKSGLVLEVLGAPGAPAGERTKVRCRITSVPRDAAGRAAPFPAADLETIFGENKVGIEFLYDPDQYWFGAALSAFGIVYNRDLLSRLGLPEPRSFADLGDPRYQGLLAMADPRQSGSVATLYDAILNKEGWDRGWKILREMCANARYFAASSTTPPTDVSQGEAAAGVSIDFYGRGQAQAILLAGQDPDTSRVGYVDPPGATYIDADPVSIINGGKSPELARRFVEYCMTDEAQALWQFPPRDQPASAGNPKGPDGQPMGPAHERLRRMPVKRSMYAAHVQHFTDRTNPFEVAMDVKRRGWRDALGPLMGAFGIDSGDELREAWVVLNAARGNTAFPPDRLAEMERLFYAMPEHTLVQPDGSTRRVTLSEATYKEVAADTARWRDPLKGTRARIEYTEFLKANYRKVIELGEQGH